MTDLDIEYERVRKEQKLKMKKKFSLILIGAAIVVIGGVLLALNFMKKSDAYITAEKYIMENPQIQAETGGITDFGMFPSGNINIHNGHGNSVLSIEVNGIKKDFEVTVGLEKEPEGEWQVIEMVID